MLLPILSSILGILAFLPFKFFWLFGFVFLAPIFAFIFREKKFWRLIAGFFVFRIILMLATLYFAFDPYIFLLSVLVFLGLPISVFFLKKFLNRFNNSLILNSYFLILSLPFLWTFFEYLQNQYSFLPMNIMTAGNIFGSSPFLGLAAIGGLNLMTFFAASINILIATIVFNSKKFGSIFIIVVILIAIILFGWRISEIQINKNATDYNTLPKTMKIGIVSTNDKFDEKFSVFKNNVFNDEEKILAESMVKNALQPIKSDLKQEKIDLLILPEDMIDIEVWNSADEKAFKKFGISNADILIKNYGDLAKELNAYLTTTFTTIRDNKRYNSSLLFNRDGELIDIHDKSRLTIASERWPFGNWRPFYYNWLNKIMPEIGKENALFDKNLQYTPGKRKILQDGDLKFASLICLEIHYPYEVKKFKEMGARFISHNTSNRWISIGSNKYLFLTDNLRKIESVWLKIPILINGRNEKAGIIMPDSKINFIDYGIFLGEIRY